MKKAYEVTLTSGERYVVLAMSFDSASRGVEKALGHPITIRAVTRLGNFLETK